MEPCIPSMVASELNANIHRGLLLRDANLKSVSTGRAPEDAGCMLPAHVSNDLSESGGSTKLMRHAEAPITTDMAAVDAQCTRAGNAEFVEMMVREKDQKAITEPAASACPCPLFS